MENSEKYQPNIESAKENKPKIEIEIDPIELEELINIARKKVMDLDQAQKRGEKFKFGDREINYTKNIKLYAAADYALRKKGFTRAKMENDIAKWYAYSKAIKNELNKKPKRFFTSEYYKDQQIDLPFDTKKE